LLLSFHLSIQKLNTGKISEEMAEIHKLSFLGVKKSYATLMKNDTSKEPVIGP